MSINELLDEFCPSCGKYVSLIEATGFCLNCTKHRFPNSAICINCGKIEPRGQFRTVCNTCQKLQWFSENADKVEQYMRAGLTYSMAITKVLFDNRPICICCDKKIKGGKKGRHFFCKGTPECKTEERYYRYQREKGVSKEEAIDKILGRLNDRRVEQVSGESAA